MTYVNPAFPTGTAPFTVFDAPTLTFTYDPAAAAGTTSIPPLRAGLARLLRRCRVGGDIAVWLLDPRRNRSTPTRRAILREMGWT